jgi:glycosyltransferase involved in cell wall biosynthesis
MRILFCTRAPLTKTLGAAKVVMELAEAVRRSGVACEVLGRDEIAGNTAESFPLALRAYLRRHAADFDVVDYDHEDLPYPRSDFPIDVLMVARSVLLVNHSEHIRWPDRPGLKYAVRRLVKGRTERRELRERISRARKTAAAADLVNVSNQADRAVLIRSNVPAAKIVVLPYGLSADQRRQFDLVPVEVPADPPTVAFVGSFDYRKGAREFPAIWDRVLRSVPQARLRLLGTAGLMQTEREVRACFGRRANRSIDVYPRFNPTDLPSLLAPCWAGVFPSWLEGFGLGVLEMLAAAIPVCAYDAPGPPEMLAGDDLVRPGDVRAVADRLVGWLTNPGRLAQARIAARARSAAFDWDGIAIQSVSAYRSAIAAKHAGLIG